MMRTVLMDTNGAVLDPSLMPVGTMYPVKHYITKTPAGEPVLVAQVDPTRDPQTVWDMARLGFFPATQTCHEEEVSAWERQRDMARIWPGRGGRQGYRDGGPLSA
jgi:hypothetical protein